MDPSETVRKSAIFKRIAKEKFKYASYTAEDIESLSKEELKQMLNYLEETKHDRFEQLREILSADKTEKSVE